MYVCMHLYVCMCIYVYVLLCRVSFRGRSRCSAPLIPSWRGTESGCTLTYPCCSSANTRRMCQPTLPSSSAASSWLRHGPAGPCTCTATKAVGTYIYIHAYTYINIHTYIYTKYIITIYLCTCIPICLMISHNILCEYIYTYIINMYVCTYV